MLEQLNAIPWERLHHAFGSAADVPGLLRALARSGIDQEEAISELFGNIWHQGTVYEASSYAVPFLVEIAAVPTITRRDEILGLIGALADGRSYLAVHADPNLKTAELFRQKPDFEERLETELADVGRTRMAVFEHREMFQRLLSDAAPLVRAGAAYVLSRFPEHSSEFGPFLRRALQAELDPLARAGMLWCLGPLRDTSAEATSILSKAMDEAPDPREGFAAAIALYRITGKRYGRAHALFRQLAAATWFAESFLNGVPWDFTAEVRLDEVLDGVEPDATETSRMLLSILDQVRLQRTVDVAITHDLLELNFPGGNWRNCKQLSPAQREVLCRLIEAEAVWEDPRRLWFLVPNGAQNISELTTSDLHFVRDEMRSIVDR